MKKILDHPLISERCFFPKHRHFPDVFVIQSGKYKLACLYHHKEEPLCVIHFHGNGEEVVDYYNSPLSSINASILYAEYRGFGVSTGKPQLVSMMDDIDAFVRASGYAPENIVFMGRSIGSIYAIEAVSRYPECAGLIIESGMANVDEFLLKLISLDELGVREDIFMEACKKYINQKAKLCKFRGKSLIMHTLLDDLIDVQSAYDFYKYLEKDSMLCIFDKGSHNSVLFHNKEEYLKNIDLFLCTLLKK